jgi:hypothetical protein
MVEFGDSRLPALTFGNVEIINESLYTTPGHDEQPDLHRPKYLLCSITSTTKKSKVALMMYTEFLDRQFCLESRLSYYIFLQTAPAKNQLAAATYE